MFDYGSINRTNFYNILPDSLLISISPSALKHPLTDADADNHIQKKLTKKQRKYKEFALNQLKHQLKLLPQQNLIIGPQTEAHCLTTQANKKV